MLYVKKKKKNSLEDFYNISIEFYVYSLMFLRNPLDMFNKTDAITEKIIDIYRG